MTSATLIKTTFNGAGLQVHRFTPLSSRQEHGSTQAGVVQEELKAFYLQLEDSRRLPSRQLEHANSDTTTLTTL